MLNKDKFLRIIDANLNRAREGLRVCEEVVRFALEDVNLTQRIRDLRHQISTMIESFPLEFKDLLKSRDSEKDVGKEEKEDKSEEKGGKKDIPEIFSLNVQRVKEAVRVLEEFSKPINEEMGKKFRELRFQVYSMEKKIVEKLSSLCNRR